MAAKLPEGDDRPEEASEPLPPDILPRAVPRDKNRGGYDCEFVEPPPSVLQIECSVCLQILKEPCLISCCGHKFCRECIERIEKDKKPCPLCNVPDFTFLRERGLERSLKDLEVWCSYRKEGCEWKGKLGKLEEHLNRDPSPENQLNGCQFVTVECTHKCGAWFQRRHITTHETQQCNKRPYSCDYCRDYHSTFEDMTEVHYPQCGKYPVACPNDCDEYKFERQKLESHLREQCPLVLVNCPFSYAGCETQLPRKDMPEHVKQNVTHLTLMAATTQRLLKENQELKQKAIEREDENMEEVRTALQELNTKYNSVVKENQELQQKAIERENESYKTMAAVQASLQELNTKYKSVVKENQKLQSELEKRAFKKNMDSVNVSLLALNAKYSSVVAENQQVHSRAAHEMRQGFKSLEDRLHEFQLKQDQLCASHVTENRNTNQKLQELVNKQQVTENEVRALNEGVQKPKLEVQQLVTQSGFPVDYHVKRTDEKIVFLPPFYTHPHGYQMCVYWYPTGYGDGKGTYVSIFTSIMPGPFDDYLKWPFRGKITIQIVNQVGDHDHVERIIPYSDETPDIYAGRVTSKEKAMGWGIPLFLAHNELQYNAERKTQYLKDNTLHIRVMKVTLD